MLKVKLRCKDETCPKFKKCYFFERPDYDVEIPDDIVYLDFATLSEANKDGMKCMYFINATGESNG